MHKNTIDTITSNNERLALSLIGEDIKSNQLINGFQSMCIDSTSYMLNLNEIIFELMGFDVHANASNDLYDVYYEFMKTVPPIHEEKPKIDKNTLSQELYNKLLALK